MSRFGAFWRERLAWVRRRVDPGGLILLYHRVTKLENDPLGFAVQPDHFREHLEVLWNEYCPVSLQQLLEQAAADRLPAKAVALTFDDGYADNLIEARPLLEKFAVPATVFVISGSAERLTDFWWDELEGYLLGPYKVRDQLILKINRVHRTWKLEGAAGKKPGARERWTVDAPHCPTSHHRVFKELLGLLKPLRESERELVLSELADWSRLGRQRRETHRALSLSEIAWLAKSGLIEIGSHTVSHPVLAKLSARSQEEEITASKATLEGLVGRPVTSFAYPFGLRPDFNAQTTELLRRSGFTRACGHFPGQVRAGGDPLQLPRMAVGDWDGEEFTRRMRQWLPR